MHEVGQLTVTLFIHVANTSSLLPRPLGHSEATCSFRGRCPLC